MKKGMGRISWLRQLMIFMIIVDIILFAVFFSVTKGFIGMSPNAIDTSLCKSLYNGNDASDIARTNIVIIGVGFVDSNDFQAAAKRVIDLEGTASQQVQSDGLMQIPAFGDNRAKLNFWYVDSPLSFTDDSPDSVWSELYNFDLISDCQEMLPTRVIPIFIYPGKTNTVDCEGYQAEADCMADGRDKWCKWATTCIKKGYPYASYGRSYVTIIDCISLNSNCPANSNPGMQDSNVHELLHTISCLGDEYGGWGNANPDNPPVPFTGTLEGNAILNFYEGSTYTDCLANAPWKSMIGNGCGSNSVIDCFKPTCTQPIGFIYGIDDGVSCCASGTSCRQEVGCFEGGLHADSGIWRSSSGGVLRNPYMGAVSGLQIINLWDQEIVKAVLDKGPASGKWDKNVALDFANNPYSPDCDVSETFISLSPPLIYGQYKFDDSIADGIATDSSGNGRNGLCSGTICPINTVGKINSAYQFDGVNDYINLGSFGDFGSLRQNSFSVSFWTYPTSTDSSSILGVGDSASNGKNALLVKINTKYDNLNLAGAIRVSLNSNDASPKFLVGGTSANDIPLNTWSYVTVIGKPSSGVLEVYVNGVKKTVSYQYQTVETNFGNFVKPLYLGAYDNAGVAGSFFKGKMDNVEIYDRVLTQEEISQLYSEGNVVVPVCTPATTQCSGNLYQTCNAQGTAWDLTTTCQANQNCVVGSGCVLKTCAEQTGDICTASESCNSAYLSASDTARCCPGANSCFIPSVQYGQYKFDDSIADGIATDYSGNGRNGLCSGTICPIDTVGKINSAYQFDGVNDYINLGSFGDFGSLRKNSFSVSFWTYPTSTASSSILGVGDTSSGKNAMLIKINTKYNNPNLAGAIRISLNSNDVTPKLLVGGTSANDVPLNTWSHVTIVGKPSSGVLEVYVNGVKKTVSYQYQTSMTNFGNFVKPLYLGAYDNAGVAGSFFKGKMDEVQFYNKALTQEEVTEIYNGI